MSRSRENETLKLSNGNTIGLAHYGDLDGPVVFYFHSLCSSRLEGVWWAKPAEALGAHIIALDRPGIGLSSIQPNRTIVDWPLVVSEVAQNLSIKQFYALGCELGGPYALACAKELPPDALRGVGVVACARQLSQSMGGKMVGSFKSWVSRKTHEKVFLRAARDPDPTAFRNLSVDGACQSSKKDKALFEKAEFRDFLVDSQRETYRQGSQGITDDVRIAVKDWGFDIRTISAKVSMWCGDGLDCSFEQNRIMASQIDQAKLVEFEGDTLHSTLATKGAQILCGLLFMDEKSDDHPIQKDADN